MAREGREEKTRQKLLDLERGKMVDKTRGFYTAWDGGESHVKVITVAGPGSTKGMSQDLEHFGRNMIQITDVSMINSDQCGFAF